MNRFSLIDVFLFISKQQTANTLDNRCVLNRNVTRRPLSGGFNHISRHELETVRQVLGEDFVGPVEIEDERLQSVQLPEHVFRCGAAITAAHSKTSTLHLRTQLYSIQLMPSPNNKFN